MQPRGHSGRALSINMHASLPCPVGAIIMITGHEGLLALLRHLCMHLAMRSTLRPKRHGRVQWARHLSHATLSPIMCAPWRLYLPPPSSGASTSTGILTRRASQAYGSRLLSVMTLAAYSIIVQRHGGWANRKIGSRHFAISGIPRCVSVPAGAPAGAPAGGWRIPPLLLF